MGYFIILNRCIMDTHTVVDPMYTLCDSSSLTNEKDHHYFLNSADVCW